MEGTKNFKSARGALKMTLGSLLVFSSMLLPHDAQSFTIISYTAQGSADTTPFSFRIDGALSNYSEMAGIELIEDFTLEDVQQVGFSMCRNGAGSTSFYARLIDSAENIIATSTSVSESSLPSCSGYASTTATAEDYTFFEFLVPFDWQQYQSVIVTQPHADTPDSTMFATSTDSASIFTSEHCYGQNGTDVIVNCINNFSMPFFIVNDSSSVNINTRIVSVNNPLNGTLQSSTNVTFDFDYFFNTTDFGKYDYVSVELTNLSQGVTVTLPKQYISLSGLDTYEFTSTLVEGDFYMWRALIHGSTTASIYSSNQTFDVVTYSGEFTSFIPPNSTSTVMSLECSDTLVAGSICNVLGYLFVPPTDTLNKYANLWKSIETKRPFGYVTKTIEQLENLNVSGSSAFTLGTLPFMDSVFTPFRTLISGILWALFAIYFYQRRLIRLDI